MRITLLHQKMNYQWSLIFSSYFFLKKFYSKTGLKKIYFYTPQNETFNTLEKIYMSLGTAHPFSMKYKNNCVKINNKGKEANYV